MILKSGNKIKNILPSIERYFLFCIYLLIAAILIRFFEAILLANFNKNFGQYLWWNLQGLVDDILLFSKVNCVILPVFLLADFFDKKTTRIAFRSLFAIMLLFSLICVIFFAVSGYFLDSIVFSYSIKEIIQIMKSSTKAPFWSYFILILIPCCFFVFSKKTIRIPRLLLYVFIAFTVIALFLPSNIFSSKSNFTSFCVKKNKEFFFWSSIFSKIKKNDVAGIDYLSFQKMVDEYQSYFPQYQFVDSQYPFCHNADYQDVLSPFFDLKETPPNFVFVILEGVGQDVALPKYKIMPFLDSLSSVGLSWKQCYSASDRTYGAFPALFGALPLGRRGFMAMSPYVPEYESLLKILAQNGYHNNFLYGGWTDFDNMRLFMEENNTKTVITHWDADIETETINASWGKEDHLMFRQALRTINFSENPRADVFLTLSSHDPWVYPDKDYYIKQYEDNWKNNPVFKNENINSPVDMCGSFSYVDNALRQLIEGYKQKLGFENTIFIITGDHSAFAVQLRGNINNHVPFIIWSPMLKKSQSFSGVASHRNLSPTLLSMLNAKYDLKTPTQVSWLNSSIDTATRLSVQTFSPFYSSDRDFVGVMYHDYMLRDGVLSQFKTAGENPVEIGDKEIQENLERLISLHSMLDQYICENNTLIKNETSSVSDSTQIILDEYDSISETGYFSQKSKLKIIENISKERGHVLNFTNENEYMGLVDYTIDRDSIHSFRIELEFKIYIENHGNDIPKAIFIIRDFKTSTLDELRYDCASKWYTYRYAYTLKKTVFNFQKGDTFKINIWNPEKVNGYLDDVKVKVTTYF